MDHLFVGQIVHCKSFNDLETIVDGYVAVQNGKIVDIGNRVDLPNTLLQTLPLTELTATQFLLPGFIDCHIHAPQYPNIGLGLDMPLLEWLETYTFPMEYNFKDNAFAQKVYAAVIRRTLDCGTTLAAYFATNYKDSSLILAEEAVKQGQRAFIGKVSSNCASPDFYVETTADSLRDNEEFIDKVLKLNSELVQPIVTPRFAVSCDTNLLNGLGEIAAKHNLNIQSHISENLSEIQFVKDEFKASNYASVYESAKLLTNKCIMAHGVHLEDEELRILNRCGTSIAHCPTSNTNLSSGLCDVRRIIDAGIKVGLGTDVSGGSSASILNAIKDALDVSQHLSFFKKQNILGSGQIRNHEANENAKYKPLTYKNALYLATLGGAEALALDAVVGNFVVGKDFDGLVIDVGTNPLDLFESPTNDLTSVPVSPERNLEKLLQQFIYVGDDRNIAKVFVAGKQVKI